MLLSTYREDYDPFLLKLRQARKEAGHWCMCMGDAGYDLAYDLNLDGCINVADIISVAAHWGGKCESNASETCEP